MGEKTNPTSKDWQLTRHRRAERSYSTFNVRRGDLIQVKKQQRYATLKVRKGGSEEIPLVQGKEQWLRFT